MKTETFKLEEKVSQLLAVLDRDIQNIHINLSRLNELRSFVVKRDNASMQKLLEGIQSESNSYKENDSERRRLREELANILGCSFKEMTLSRIETKLSAEKKNEVTERKIKLKTLAEKLKKEHLSTVMLLTDCARFNSMLLKGILELGHARTITYSPKGLAERQSSSAFMNMQF